MSRIGKKPVVIPDKVKVTKEGNAINIEGAKGKAQHNMNPGFEYKIEGNTLTVVPRPGVEANKKWNALFGMERAIINNKVIGVLEGYSKVLVLKGVGYRATLAGTTLNFTLGFSHPSEYKLPAGITALVENQTRITISGIDKHMVGKVAAEIKRLKPPEPYQGKGVMYENEKIRRKAGKSAAGAKK